MIEIKLAPVRVDEGGLAVDYQLITIIFTAHADTTVPFPIRFVIVDSYSHIAVF